MARVVKRGRQPRTLRAEQAEQTRRRIVDAARELFLKNGYSATTIAEISEQAGVAVETVYSRFRSKSNLLRAILEIGIVDGDDGRDLLEHPAVAEIRSAPDQRTQVQLLAAFSRGILERTYTAHRVLRSAAATDLDAAKLQQRDTQRRCAGQRRYIAMLQEKAALRTGLTPEDAADTYSALANPSTFAFLVDERDWTPEKYQHWLADTLARLLLSPRQAA
jgi:AcrR family transcriptional regulator